MNSSHRYFIELSYDGAPFIGWQRQPTGSTVQSTLEEALSRILRLPNLEITGCGRTDTGVHASFYIAHFEIFTPITLNPDFIYHLNCILPPQIAVYKIYPTLLHARFDAREREYQYHISQIKDPFSRDYAWQLTTLLDVDAMNSAAQMLLQTDDFTSFAKLNADNKTNICHVNYAVWHAEKVKLTFTIRSDRFLRGMVRGIVGTLVDVGRGKLTPDDVAKILTAKNRSLASSQAPAHALFLTDIKY